MASRPNDCDRNRLRLSLEDKVSEAEQAELADHVEWCLDCRRQLEQMAAASGYWGDAKLLRGEPAAGASATVGIVRDEAAGPESENEFDDFDAGLREFLEPPDPAHPETIGRMGSYEILEVLGRGGMGVVLKARDPGLDRTVAIKVLTPALAHGATARRRFAREARAVAAVGHEHIDRLLAKEPADRFQTAAEVADLLERGLAHLQQPTNVPAPLVPRVDDLADLAIDLGPLVSGSKSRVSRLVPAAAVVLLTIAGLGVAEAAGLTQVSDFVASILRVKTLEGTMVIKVTDPTVTVRIDGDMVVIGGAGPQEIRLRAGRHRVQTIKDGKPVRDQLVTITRGGKEIVNIDFELGETGMVAESKHQPDMTAPRSHANQCMICHGNANAMKADGWFPSNHPQLYPPAACGNARKDWRWRGGQMPPGRAP